MDTGADVTVVNSQSWPSAWRTRPASKALIGLDSPQSVSQNALPLLYVESDGQIGISMPFIVPISINLCDRDLMKEWGSVLVTSAAQKCISSASKLMVKMGYGENKDLGKNLQGGTLSFEPLVK